MFFFFFSRAAAGLGKFFLADRFMGTLVRISLCDPYDCDHLYHQSHVYQCFYKQKLLQEKTTQEGPQTVDERRQTDLAAILST